MNTYSTIEEIKQALGVKSSKEIGAYTAIRRGGLWHYFALNDSGKYEETGSTFWLHWKYCQNCGNEMSEHDYYHNKGLCWTCVDAIN